MTTLDIDTRMHRQFEIEQFYYDEAALLDERRYDEWIELFTDDTHYWMPIRRTRMANDLEKEFTAPGAMAFFDDGKGPLEARVRKLYTGYAWAEDPPSRTRHFITNVRVIEDDGEQLTVEANFHLYRTRLESEEDSWIGRRRDVLRRTDGSFKIADRKIFLEQTVLLSKNLSSFF
ncbi:MAG: 3-phenylpropionate/cinnamic acid dioxygenase subunit beta [Dehalococcoidia bacterium]